MGSQNFITPHVVPFVSCFLHCLAVTFSTLKGPLDLFLGKIRNQGLGPVYLLSGCSKKKRSFKIKCRNSAFIKHLWAPGIVLTHIHVVSQMPELTRSA